MSELSTKELIERRVAEIDKRAPELQDEIKGLRKEVLKEAEKMFKERKEEIKASIKELRAERRQLTGSATGAKRKPRSDKKDEASRTETFTQPQEDDTGSLESFAAE